MVRLPGGPLLTFMITVEIWIRFNGERAAVRLISSDFLHGRLQYQERMRFLILKPVVRISFSGFPTPKALGIIWDDMMNHHRRRPYIAGISNSIVDVSHLKTKNICSRWIPYNLTVEQKKAS